MNHIAYRHVSMPCPVMRGSLWLILEGSGEFEVVGRARDGEEAVVVWATGYIRKVSGMERLLTTVRDFAAGELLVPADVVTRVFARIRAGAEKRGEKGLGGLTQRDLEILTSFAQGMSYAKTAEARGVKQQRDRKRVNRSTNCVEDNENNGSSQHLPPELGPGGAAAKVGVFSQTLLHGLVDGHHGFGMIHDNCSRSCCLPWLRRAPRLLNAGMAINSP